MGIKQVVRVAIADDHPIVRAGVVSCINSSGKAHVEIEADNGIQLIKAIKEAPIPPDVCIIDINMPGMNGFDTTAELKKLWPGMGVLVLTVFEMEMYLVRMVLNGANGYLLKSCDPEEIITALVSIYNHGFYYSDTASRQFFNAVRDRIVKLPNLTAMEQKALKLMCTNLSYREIAEAMNTTPPSIEGFRVSLCKKLNVTSRVGLALFAVRLGIVTID